jgi:glycosyltransferase involved in cell wall biosynthesis
MNQKPVVTVITVVFNAGQLVARTMESVASQSWPHIEHLVIDGMSTDNTLEVVSKYNRPALKVFSDRDQGIYDAMNKGLDLATGDYVVFMNAGDEFYGPLVIERALNDFPQADFYYGNTAVVDADGNVLGNRRLTPPEKLNWKSLQFGMCVSHQSMIVRRSKCVKFDLQYKISADIDWTIRTLQQCETIVNLHDHVSRFLVGGISAKRRKASWFERYRIMSRHYGPVQTFFNHIWILIRFIWHKLTRRSMT